MDKSQRCEMIIKHDGATPRIDPAAWIAPNAVACGNVTIGPGCCVMFGAQVIAEGGSVSIGRECIIMENAVLRSSARHSLRARCSPCHFMRGEKAAIVINGRAWTQAANQAEASTIFTSRVHVERIYGSVITFPVLWPLADMR